MTSTDNPPLICVSQKLASIVFEIESTISIESATSRPTCPEAMKKKQLLLQSIDRCERLLVIYPDMPQLESLRGQLGYLLDLEEGRTSDLSNLSRLSIGLITAREIDDRDPELAELLYQVMDTVRKTRY